MPPPFYPANHNPSIADSNAGVRFPRHPSFGASQSPMHDVQQGPGNLVFGGYTESSGSSPAPPASSGNMAQFAPPGFQHDPAGAAQVQHFTNGHSHNFSNGYSPLGPPGPLGFYPRQDMYNAPAAGNDNFVRRQIGPFSNTENYSPTVPYPIVDGSRSHPFDPTTPHSFHGSQSSAHNDSGEFGPFNNQYASGGLSNGVNGHMDDVRLYQQPRPKGRTGSQSLLSGHGGHGSFPQMPMNPTLAPSMDDLDGLVQYITNQFADPTFADYTLELRYVDDRAPPVRIPGHNLLFARSPTLNKLMRAQAESNNDGMTVRTLLLETDDRFLRSDSFSMAAQRLYGGPLLDAGSFPSPSNYSNAHTSTGMPGTPTDRFELALGYAAAGHILRIPPVITRGIDIASRFVSWNTVEKSLDFALDGSVDSQWTADGSQESIATNTYGPTVNGLIHSALTFLVTNFPPNFDLDVSLQDPLQTPRLPVVPESRPAISNQRLSSIKFGDHPSEDSVKSTSANPVVAALSRVLLALPFQLLKYVLESPRLGNVEGWATTKLRQRVMYTVIEERERRRIRAYTSRAVSNPERLANRRRWETVGWQEYVILNDPEHSVLDRKQVDFLLPDE